MEQAKDILPRLFQGLPDAPEFRLELVRAYWPEVVGPLMAANCRPRKLRGSELVVEIADLSWMEEFWPLRGQALALLRREFPSAGVESVRAVLAGEEGPAPGRGRHRRRAR